MNPRCWSIGALLLLLSVPPTTASARGLSVEVATDRGHNAVYRTGDPLVIEARTSEDAHLLVYEIDAEGYVHLLHPDRHSDTFVQGDRTYYLPDDRSDFELVVRGPTGQGYIVAIASAYRFEELPWYLRPYDAQAEEMGYDGERDEDAGVTAEGRIVGDPFVAMERIRRIVLADPNDEESFASAYASYYVGHEVRYPRYLCYDCHRPGYWSWWSSFDPYDAHCNVFDFRVNRRWHWGPSYWMGHVPYYVFVYRTDCPPRYRVYGSRGTRHSSWDGWPRWRQLWGGPLRRYRTDPVPRTVSDPARRWPKDTPPGYLTRGSRPFRGGLVSDPKSRDGGERAVVDRREVRQRAAEIRERLKAARAGIRDPRRLGDAGGRRAHAEEPRRFRGDADRGRAREAREGLNDGGRTPRGAPPLREERGARERGGDARESRPPREERGRERGGERRDRGEARESRGSSRSWLQIEWNKPLPVDERLARLAPPSPPAFDAPRPQAYEVPRPAESRPISADVPRVAPPAASPSPQAFRQPAPDVVRRVERGRRQ